VRSLARLLVLAPIVCAPVSALAEIHDLGGRLGIRLDPDQVVLGGHATLWTPGENVRLVGVPSLGFGDDVTLLDLAADVHFVFRESPVAERTYFYVGAGPDLSSAWVSVGDDTENDVDLGITLLGGVESVAPGRTGWFGEFRVRLDDRDEWFGLEVGFRLPE